MLSRMVRWTTAVTHPSQNLSEMATVGARAHAHAGPWRMCTGVPRRPQQLESCRSLLCWAALWRQSESSPFPSSETDSHTESSPCRGSPQASSSAAWSAQPAGGTVNNTNSSPQKDCRTEGHGPPGQEQLGRRGLRRGRRGAIFVRTW